MKICLGTSKAATKRVMGLDDRTLLRYASRVCRNRVSAACNMCKIFDCNGQNHIC